MKKTTDTSAKDKKEAKKLKKSMEPQKKKKEGIFDSQTRARSTWKLEEYMTEEALDKKLAELVASRGRKGTDSRVLLRQLEMLSKAAKQHGPRKEIPVLMHLISAMFDTHKQIDDYMEIPKWTTCHRCLTRVMTLLEENKDITLGALPTEDVADALISSQTKSVLPRKTGEEDEGKVSGASSLGFLQVVGNIEVFVARLEDEYTKSLQHINPHTKVGYGVIVSVLYGGR